MVLEWECLYWEEVVVRGRGGGGGGGGKFNDWETFQTRWWGLLPNRGLFKIGGMLQI